MKAVIVEIKNGNAAVLSDDGCIVTIKNNNYEIGQVIQMSSPKIRFSKKIAAFAASAAALVVFSVGTWAYASPYSYVSVDVNPSIEYTLNRFDRVLSVKAVNDDGEEILKEISLDDLENQTIEDAITATFQQISDAGYFDGDIEGGIVITTAGQDEDKAAELAAELEQTVEAKAEETGDDVQVEAMNVSLERVQQAHELGVTPGKLNLVEKLQAASTDPSTISLDEWLNKPVREIMKATKDYRKATAVSGSAISLKEKDQKQADKEDKKAHQQTGKDTKKAQQQVDKSADKAAKVTKKADAYVGKEDVKVEKTNTKVSDKSDKKDDKIKVTPAAKSDKKVTTQDKATKDAAKDNKKSDQGNNNSDNSNKNTKTDQNNPKKDPASDSGNGKSVETSDNTNGSSQDTSGGNADSVQTGAKDNNGSNKSSDNGSGNGTSSSNSGNGSGNDNSHGNGRK